MRRAVPPPQGEGFLSRWSRLKREPEPAPVEPAPPAATEPALPEGRTLDDLIAELPKVEDLVPGQSVSAFMQPWVPTPLRNAALQRMWLLDPAIRDYVSPALDYAYDYNTPGAAPGFGPIETTKDMVREVAELFDRALSRVDAGNDPQSANDIVSQAESTDDAASQHVVPVSADAEAVETRNPPAECEDATAPSGPAVAAAHNDSRSDKHLAPPKRRNGGALPA
ncbi:DUF3306 domain-containing protein [Phreatobacter sp.]|uniref:DUF3306 domain-containing protein n=1 Tax=Phreatobacter sp. TaxID=1966341 RepID=UPI0022C82524|nr:DUF3306 domain-containing protein [Phreatobacter sp.]MCZ8315668.1 DUF3306 domain-containing protein [Phreatobacter sp.]